MKALVIPFGYPGYPEDVMFGRIEEGKRHLSKLNINFESTDSIIELKDVPAVRLKMKTTDFDYIIVMVATWIEVTHVMELVDAYKHKPMLLWCHENLRQEGVKELLSLGAIASAGVLRQAFEEFEYRFKFIVGNPFDEKIDNDIRAFDSASKTIAAMQDSRIGFVGYTSLGMYTGMADHIKVKKTFGAELFHIDQFSILNNLDAIDSTKVEQVKSTLLKEWDVKQNVSGEHINKTALIYLRLKELMEKQLLNSACVKCQYEMSIEYNFSPCVALSLLGEQYPVCCEGDVHEILSQLILHNLSGQVTTYGDILEFLDDGVICAACGFAPKCFLAPDRPVIDTHTAIISGLLITSPFKEKPVTMIRIANDKNGYKLHLIKGHIEELKDFHEIGCPQYAGSIIRFENKTGEQFKNEIMSQHYALVMGDYEAAVRQYCDLMDIRIV